MRSALPEGCARIESIAVGGWTEDKRILRIREAMWARSREAGF